MTYETKAARLLTESSPNPTALYVVRAKELGSEVMNDLRRKEIAKWGSRAGR